jgi:ATP-dependent protease HslVU (ClpYQ) peptidase subunit
VTCVVGVTDRRGVIIGADSASVDDETSRLEIVRTPKVFCRRDVLIGFAGGWAVGHRLRHQLVVPPASGTSARRFVEAALAPEILEALDGEEEWDVLVAIRGRVFHVSADGYVQEPRERFLAIGAGAAAARGALLAMARDKTLTLQSRARRALLAAEADSSTVRRPFRYRRA